MLVCTYIQTKYFPCYQISSEIIGYNTFWHPGVHKSTTYSSSYGFKRL